jgi:signal transduction histidine kinase
MVRIPPRVIGPAGGLTVTVLVAGGFALGLRLDNLHNGLLAVAFTAVGLYVVRQRPDNREAWLFVATGIAQAAMFAARQYGLHTPALPAASWIGWLGVWPLPLVFVLIAVTLMSFPTGRLPAPSWRVVVVMLAVLGVALALMSALWPVEYERVPLAAPHPLDLPGADTAAAVHRVAMAIGYPAFQLAWVVCAIARLVRAEGDESRQLRWFVLAMAMTGVVMGVGLIGWGTPRPGLLAVPLVPVAAGAAVLRYRLYDVDPIIRATLVWGAMAAVVTLGYAVVVVAVGNLIGGSGTLLELLATALVAVVFGPLRGRAQRVADRVVYGRRASPYELLSRLSAQLTGPSSGLLDGLCATVADGTGARQVVLWTGPPDGLRAVSAWPAGCPPEVRTLDELAPGEPSLGGRSGGRPALGGCAVPVTYAGRTIGALAVTTGTRRSWTSQERGLLADLAAQAGLVLELRASAQRLVAAGDEARRRLERDLHDGAQQRLVTVAMELGALARSAAGAAASAERVAEGAAISAGRVEGAAVFAERAEAARQQLLQATAELRETARGLHPAVLTQDGLQAALGYLADRSALPVRLRVDVDRRLAPAVEATAYFVVSEGLTNAAKHARAQVTTVTAELTEQGLALEVGDDGVGGARPQPGSGLEGLTDRLAALDARLLVDSGPAGTRLRTVIPCG